MIQQCCLARTVAGYRDGVVQFVNEYVTSGPSRSYIFTPKAHAAIVQTCSAFLTLVEQRSFKKLPLHSMVHCYLLGRGLCEAVQRGSFARSFVQTAEYEAEMAAVEKDGPLWLSVTTAFDLDCIADEFRPIAFEVGEKEICLLEECDED